MLDIESYYRDITTRPELLERFRDLNPRLVAADDDTDRCGNLWNLLTSQHRLDPDCCSVQTEDRAESLFCFVDHTEW